YELINAWTELIVEGVYGLAAPPGADPDDLASVMVGDHSQVTMTAFIGDVVNADPIKPIQAGVIETLGHNPFDDSVDGGPGTTQQTSHRRLVHPLRQPGDGVFEVTRAPRPRPGPGHLLGA